MAVCRIVSITKMKKADLVLSKQMIKNKNRLMYSEVKRLTKPIIHLDIKTRKDSQLMSITRISKVMGTRNLECELFWDY